MFWGQSVDGPGYHSVTGADFHNARLKSSYVHGEPAVDKYRGVRGPCGWSRPFTPSSDRPPFFTGPALRS